MNENTWSKPVFREKNTRHSNWKYAALMLSVSWICFWLLNTLLLASGILNGNTTNISIGITAYSIFGLICLLPGCLIFAMIAAFRKLFKRHKSD